MAERSFAAEVRQLAVPAGTEFHGEGILAVASTIQFQVPSKAETVQNFLEIKRSGGRILT